MAGCRNVVRRGGSPPPRPGCIFDVYARLEAAMMRRVGIGHPKVWVMLMDMKRQLVKLGCKSRSLIWSVLLYFCGSSTEAPRQAETTWDERIGIDWL